MSQLQENCQKEGMEWKDRPLHRTLPVTARGLMTIMTVIIIAMIIIKRNPKHQKQVTEKGN